MQRDGVAKSEEIPAADRDGGQPPSLVRLTEALLPQALGLSQEMDWPYRLDDWTFAHGLGKGLAVVQSGQVAATAMWWPNGEAFATAGMIIVRKVMQGRGLGARIFDGLLEDIGPRSVLLNSTAEGYELYRRRGFAPIGRIQQHQGRLAPFGSGAPRDDVRPARGHDWESIVQLDAAALDRPRGPLLERLAAAGRFTVIERGAMLRGFAVSRPFGRGHVIGPVVAADLDDAKALIAAAAADLVSAFVRVDTPEETDLGPWLAARGLKQVGGATTMVRGAPPAPREGQRAFALCSQSLG